jgi:hypothetical protein
MYYPSGSWSDDGNIIAALNVADGLSRVAAGGGEPELLGMKGQAEEVFRWPQVLPGGEAVLFSSARGDYENGNIDVLSLKTGERKTVVRGGILGKYAAGYLLYVHQNELLAAPFDLKDRLKRFSRIWGGGLPAGITISRGMALSSTNANRVTPRIRSSGSTARASSRPSKRFRGSIRVRHSPPMGNAWHFR